MNYEFLRVLKKIILKPTLGTIWQKRKFQVNRIFMVEGVNSVCSGLCYEKVRQCLVYFGGMSILVIISTLFNFALKSLFEPRSILNS